MIEGLQPYPEYRDSGLPWLGSIPAHWRVERLRSIAELLVSNVDKHTKDGEVPVRLCNYTDVYKNAEIRPDMSFMRATATPDEARRFCLRTGDVVITKDSEDWRDIAIPALVTGEAEDLVCGYHLAILRAREAGLLGGYLYHCLRGEPIAWQFRVEANGVTRHGLSHGAIRDARVPIPPPEEQAAIVRFLDRVDERVQRFIRAKRGLIELLDEQKRAVIHQAVTRGLDPNARRRPSGVDWLGDVLEHWTVCSLRFRYDQCLGKMVDAKKFTGRHLTPYLRNVDVRWDHINTTDLPLIDIAPSEHDRYTLRPGDLLVCEGRHLGRCAFWTGEIEPCAFQKALHRLRPLDSNRDDPRFLFYCMLTANALDAFNRNRIDNAIPHLTGEMLRAHQFPFPASDEQRAIASHLDHQCERIERARSQSEEEIQATEEYVTRLVADVVTGKLDVRDALPAESVQVPAKSKPANKHFCRTVLAAEIVERHRDTKKFGKVKLQKLIILAERHLRLTEIDSAPKRAAAGPFDNAMMRSIEKQFRSSQWYAPTKREGGGTEYVPLEKCGGHRTYFDKWWSSRRQEFDALVALLKPLDTKRSEIVATLYMAWNDFLIRGESFDDARLVEEVRERWHDAKKEIPEDRWHKAIAWMREKGLVPTGFGTETTREADA